MDCIIRIVTLPSPHLTFVTPHSSLLLLFLLPMMSLYISLNFLEFQEGLLHIFYACKVSCFISGFCSLTFSGHLCWDSSTWCTSVGHSLFFFFLSGTSLFGLTTSCSSVDVHWGFPPPSTLVLRNEAAVDIFEKVFGHMFLCHLWGDHMVRRCLKFSQIAKLFHGGCAVLLSCL